nr:MutS-like protein [Muricella sp. ANT77]
MKNIPTQYLDLAKKHQSVYGLSVIQFIQIGKFYELWHEIEAPSVRQTRYQADLLGKPCLRGGTLEATPPLDQVAALLNMRKTTPVNRRFLSQVGFPVFTLGKHLSTLLEKGWTVIAVDELNTGQSGPKQRAVSQVHSPSCNLEECSELPYVLSIYFSQDKLGLTIFSVMSGHSIVFPVSWGDREQVARLIINYRIREIVIWANLEEGTELRKMYDLLIGWNLFPYEPHAKIEVMGKTRTNSPYYLSYRYENNNEWLLLHIYVGLSPEWFNKNYQEYTLSKIFKSSWTVSADPANIISLLGALQFVKDRNSELIKNLQLPECHDFVVSPLNLVLCNRAEYQLNLLSQRGKLGGLLSLIDFCSTAMGKRLLKHRLLNPITDTSELNLRYKDIATLKQLINNKTFSVEIKHIKDLSSLHRQWAICASGEATFKPQKLSQIYQSYLSAGKLWSELRKCEIDIQLPPSVEPQLESLIEEMGRVFQVDRLTGDFKDIIQPTVNLTNLLAQQRSLRDQLTEWAQQTSSLVFEDTISIKAGHFSKEGYAFSISPRKLKKLEHYMKDSKCTITPLRKMENNYIITSSTTQKVSLELNSLEEQIYTYVKHTYNRELKRLYFKFFELFHPLERLISRLDVALSGAIAATKFDYTKPGLMSTNSQQTKGSIEAINLRHPLVEQLNTQEDCVAHNIKLEGEGMLIFSVNGAGKSTFLRAIGVNVILAQAGLYVAADSFRLRPYQYLVPRILGGDDILKGQGTFEVEMRDLSTILKLAEYNSLILGDEICHGTEVSSGTAILATTIDRLTAAQTSFVLSTHLHQVLNLNESVRCCHLSVIREDSGLIYERKLKPGPGPSQYGIEVMNHIIRDQEFYDSALNYRDRLNWDQEFYDSALNYRKRLNGEPPPLGNYSSLTKFRPSRHNAKVYIDLCEICNAAADDIHHIKPKNSENKRINRRSNLVAVCKKCHLDIHSGKINILGWKGTPGHKILYWDRVKKS